MLALKLLARSARRFRPCRRLSGDVINAVAVSDRTAVDNHTCDKVDVKWSLQDLLPHCSDAAEATGHA